MKRAYYQMNKSKRKNSQEALNREALIRIETVLNKVRGFAYDPKLLDDATWLVGWAKHQAGSLSKYRAISLALEIDNEYGHSNRSKSTIEEFKKDIENEFDIAPNAFENLSENEIDTYKRRLDQVCWVYAGAAITHYWFNENEEGLGWIRKARDIIENYITKPHK